MKSILCLLCFASLAAFGQMAKTVGVSRVEEYKLSPLESINTKKAEFSPVPFTDGLVFVAEQKTDVVNFENADPGGNPYLDVFYCKLKKEKYSRKKSFSKKHNTQFHDGPISFNNDFSQAFLTRAMFSKRKKGSVNQSKLYVMQKKGSGWEKPVLFAYDSDDYSIGHASISKDGKKLFFASDMPGGYGGTDLYVCNWNGTSWDKPQNLGPSLNSASNELYPFIRKDNVLFFSSNKLGGLGGLDIYSAEELSGKWILNRNEGLNINTIYDDFGICFTDSANGFVSSNRSGNDDLYKFVFTKKLVDFDGFVLNSRDLFDPATNLKVELTDSAGNKISETRTDSNGYFRFRSLDSDESYLVRIDETDPGFSGLKHYYYADRNNTILRVTNKKNGDMFVFKNLPKDRFAIPELELDDAQIIAGNLLISKDPAVPLANVKISLKDGDGNLLEEVTTNEFGSFVLTKIPPDQSFFLEVNESDSPIPVGSLITLTNKNGKTIKTMITSGANKFSLHVLNTDKQQIQDMNVADTDLLLNFSSIITDQKGVPITNLVVYLKDEDQKTIEKSSSDDNGWLNFKKLSTDKNYILAFEENEPKLNGVEKVLLKNAQGKTIKELIITPESNEYKVLKTDISEMSELYVNDPWLSINELNKSAERTMDLITIVTDDAGNPLANLNVYLKDGDKMVSQMKSDNKGQVSFKKLLTDRNYVLEFDENDPRLGALQKIILKSKKGKIVHEILQSNGKFRYALLKTDVSELGEIEVEDPEMADINLHKKEIVIEENVYYAYGDYRFDEAGKKVLEKVVKIMKDNPNITIELGSHTDSRADDNFNLKLSQKRAQTAVAFIVKNGISKNRIKAIGYGETRLKNKCGNNVECTEEEHAQNRRTEFKVISR